MTIKKAFKAGFSVGYKKGYCHRSDKEYEEAMFKMWKTYIAGSTDKGTTWGNGRGVKIEGELEIVEPEKLLK